METIANEPNSIYHKMHMPYPPYTVSEASITTTDLPNWLGKSQVNGYSIIQKLFQNAENIRESAAYNAGFNFATIAPNSDSNDVEQRLKHVNKDVDDESTAINDAVNSVAIHDDSDDNDVEQSSEQRNERVDDGSSARNEGGNSVSIS